MALKLLFFAQSADWLKRSQMRISIDKPMTIEAVLKNTKELSPIFDHREILKVSINCKFADFKTEVCDGDEVAFLPPVSGG